MFLPTGSLFIYFNCSQLVSNTCCGHFLYLSLSILHFFFYFSLNGRGMIFSTICPKFSSIPFEMLKM